MTEDKVEEGLKELGLVVGTKDEALWNRVAEQAKQLIDEAENTIKIHTELLRIAKERTKDVVKV